jgi:hypothetical protein
MRPIEFIFNIIDKFSPMEETERANLRNDANMDYVRVKNELFESTGMLKEGVKPKSIKQFFVRVSERWEIRTLFAMLFIYVVPKIQDYLNPEGVEDDDYEDEFYEDDDDDDDDYDD